MTSQYDDTTLTTLRKLCDEKCGHLVLRVGHEHVTTGALFFFLFYTDDLRGRR